MAVWSTCKGMTVLGMIDRHPLANRLFLQKTGV